MGGTGTRLVGAREMRGAIAIAVLAAGCTSGTSASPGLGGTIPTLEAGPAEDAGIASPGPDDAGDAGTSAEGGPSADGSAITDGGASADGGVDGSAIGVDGG